MSLFSLSGLSRLAGSTYVKLCLVLALGYSLSFTPHYRYDYPLHVDEWLHLSYFKAIQSEGSTEVSNVPLYEFPDPASGKVEVASGDVEKGFHLFWAIFQQVTGISWMAIFRYFPGVVFLLTILSAYVLGRKYGVGLEAALLASLIPTNVTMLGPSFLVPVALGMLYVPLSILLAFNFKTKGTYLVVFIIASFLISAHPPTAVGLAMVLLPFILLNMRKDLRHSAAIAAVLAAAFLIFLPPVLQVLPPIDRSFLGTEPAYLPYLPKLFSIYGYVATALFVAGSFFLARRGELKDYSLILGCMLLLIHMSVFTAWGLGIQIIYHRSPLYLMLLTSVLGGFGYRALSRIPMHLKVNVDPLNHLSRRRAVALALQAILVGLLLFETVKTHSETPFYRMIDSEDYRAFLWIEENLADGEGKAILDPWKATAFMALARMEAYARIHHAPMEEDLVARQFLDGGSKDTELLRLNRISLVYSRDEVSSADLVHIGGNTYVLPEMLSPGEPLP